MQMSFKETVLMARFRLKKKKKLDTKNKHQQKIVFGSFPLKRPTGHCHDHVFKLKGSPSTLNKLKVYTTLTTASTFWALARNQLLLLICNSENHVFPNVFFLNILTHIPLLYLPPFINMLCFQLFCISTRILRI